MEVCVLLSLCYGLIAHLMFTMFTIERSSRKSHQLQHSFLACCSMDLYTYQLRKDQLCLLVLYRTIYRCPHGLPTNAPGSAAATIAVQQHMRSLMTSQPLC